METLQNTSRIRTWQLDASTIVQVRFMGTAKPLVSVNSVEVTTERNRIGWLAYDALFKLPDGRACVIAFRTQRGGGPTYDLQVGSQRLLDPFRQTFKCRACGRNTAPGDRVCSGCAEQQPDVADRLRERRTADVSRAIALSLIWVAFFGASLISAGRVHSASALASLQAAGAHAAASSSASAVSAQARIAVVSVVGALVMLGLAQLAKRMPLTAVLTAAAIWLALIITVDMTATKLRVLPLAVQAYILFSLWRTTQVALQTHATRG